MSRRSVMRLGVGTLTVLAAVAVGKWIGAASPPAGSSGDPLVTRSYVTQALGTAFAENGGRVRTLKPGQVFTLNAGTSCVLLGGAAAVASPPATRAGVGSPLAPSVGAVDVTVGRALAASGAAPLDHLLVAARTGVSVTAGSGGAVLWLSGPQASSASATP